MFFHLTFTSFFYFCYVKRSKSDCAPRAALSVLFIIFLKVILECIHLFFNLTFILYWSIVDLQCVVVPGAHQSDLVIHIHVSILFQILFPCSLLHIIESSSLCFTMGSLLVIYFIYECIYVNPQILTDFSPSFPHW